MKPRHLRQSPALRWLLRLAASLVLAFALFLLADWMLPLPAANDDFARLVVAADGTPLRAFADDEGVWRYPVQVSQVSPYYLQALLNYEDRWFYQHPGINPIALARAAAQDLFNGQIVSGGSTLTMQAARLLDPHERTLPGKLKQMFRALQLEWHWNKTQILTYYLNHAPFGGTLEGVQAASFSYFGHDAKRLSRAEAALLAVLPQAPSYYRPDRHPERALAARDKVLQRMEQLQVWSPEQVQDALQEPLVALPLKRDRLAPLLARRLTATLEQRVIHSFIDRNLQAALEQQVHDYVQRLAKRTSAAVLVVDNASLEVRAYVGSADFLDNDRFGHVDMVQALRSPGSTLKPFLYGMAMDAGLVQSQSLLIDAPLEFQGYAPENFSEGFAGPVSLSEALQRSLNLPAVQVLEEFGPKRFHARLQNAGLDLQLPQQASPNLSLILGGAGARLEDLVGAYSALANGGQAGALRLTPQQPLQRRPLLSAGSAWIIRQILSDNPRPNQPRYSGLFRAPRQIAWKTGTSYGFRDSWAIGVGPRFTVGVWIGRPDGTPSPGYYGAVSAAPLLFQIADQLPGPNAWLDPMPASVHEQTICWPLGGSDLSSPDCLQQREHAWILNDNYPPTWPGTLQQQSDWPSNPLPVQLANDSGLRTSLDCDLPSSTHWIALWPRALEPWLPTRWRRRSLLPALDPRCHAAAQLADIPLEIQGINPGTHLHQQASSTHLPDLQLYAAGAQGETFWFVNGQFRARVPAHEAFVLDPQQRQRYQLAVTDSAGNTDSLEFWVE